MLVQQKKKEWSESTSTKTEKGKKHFILLTIAAGIQIHSSMLLFLCDKIKLLCYKYIIFVMGICKF